MAESLQSILTTFIDNIQNLMADQKAEFIREFRQIITYGDQVNLFDNFTTFEIEF